MTRAIDHQTCSSRLRAYVAGELGGDAAREVETHLRSCPECESERRVVVALAEQDFPSLTDAERSDLHAGVVGAISPPEPARLAADGRWRTRLGSALAAAALLVVLAIGAAYVLTGGRGGGAATGGGAGAESEPQEELATDQERAAAPLAKPELSAARLRFDATVGKLSVDRLRRIGRTNPVFRAASQAYTPRDAPRLTDRFLSRLAAQAPPGLAGQLDRCVDAVLAGGGPLLPVYAAEGRLEGRNALVVGFVRGRPKGDRLDGYQVWTWPEGSCEAPVVLQSGRIAP